MRFAFISLVLNSAPISYFYMRQQGIHIFIFDSHLFDLSFLFQNEYFLCGVAGQTKKCFFLHFHLLQHAHEMAHIVIGIIQRANPHTILKASACFGVVDQHSACFFTLQ